MGPLILCNLYIIMADPHGVWFRFSFLVWTRHNGSNFGL